MYQMEQIPSKTKINKFFKKILYGEHLFCPHCHSYNVVVYEQRYRCLECRGKFSLLSHTWLGNTKLPVQELWLILWCWTKQMPVRQTQDLTSLSEKAVRHWFTLFRTHLPNEQEVLEHIVQLDEAYFGGLLGVALLMGKQEGSRKLAYTVLPHNHPSKLEALEFLQAFVKPDTVLHTDGGAIYKGIQKHYPVTHTVDIHKKFEFTNTSEIEGMFGVLRTFIRRMYHHTTTEKFPEYMCEFYFRFCRPELFDSPHEYLKYTLHLVPTR